MLACLAAPGKPVNSASHHHRNHETRGITPDTQPAAHSCGRPTEMWARLRRYESLTQLDRGRVPRVAQHPAQLHELAPHPLRGALLSQPVDLDPEARRLGNLLRLREADGQAAVRRGQYPNKLRTLLEGCGRLPQQRLSLARRPQEHKRLAGLTVELERREPVHVRWVLALTVLRQC